MNKATIEARTAQSEIDSIHAEMNGFAQPPARRSRTRRLRGA
jgi:hypothetical protein